MACICPYCNSEATLRPPEDVYGSSGNKYNHLWICSNYPACDAYVGSHKKTLLPLGRLANVELRKWKMLAHQAFDPLWKSKIMERNIAYQYIASLMCMSREECHIGLFDIQQCKDLIERLKWYSPYKIDINTGSKYSQLIRKIKK